jgi:hypothetical protein
MVEKEVYHYTVLLNHYGLMNFSSQMPLLIPMALCRVSFPLPVLCSSCQMTSLITSRQLGSVILRTKQEEEA